MQFIMLTQNVVAKVVAVRCTNDRMDIRQFKMPLTDNEVDRIIQMAWEDRTAFDAILAQFGLTPGEVIKLMRDELKFSSFRLWRSRTTGRKTKHSSLRNVDVVRFRFPDQKNS